MPLKSLSLPTCAKGDRVTSGMICVEPHDRSIFRIEFCSREESATASRCVHRQGTYLYREICCCCCFLYPHVFAVFFVVPLPVLLALARAPTRRTVERDAYVYSPGRRARVPLASFSSPSRSATATAAASRTKRTDRHLRRLSRRRLTNWLLNYWAT